MTNLNHNHHQELNNGLVTPQNDENCAEKPKTCILDFKDFQSFHKSSLHVSGVSCALARVPRTPEGLCVEAVFFSPFQPLFRSPQTWMRQIAAVASRHCCNFTDAVTCPGRSTKLFAFQCRKHSPVSQLRNSTQHSRANAPPSPCRQCCLE